MCRLCPGIRSVTATLYDEDAVNDISSINPERDGRLNEAVVAFLEAVEAGETPDPDQWLKTYPDLRSELEEFFADQHQLGQWTDSLRSIVRVARADVPRETSDQP